jgi:hypothetical protein
MLLQLEASRKAKTGGDGLTKQAVTGQGRCSERHVKAHDACPAPIGSTEWICPRMERWRLEMEMESVP